MSVYSEKLSSISEYGEGSNRTSLTGLSYYAGSYSQQSSPPHGSLNTLASVSTRSYKSNGHSSDRQSTSNDSSTQIMTQRIGRGSHKQSYELCKKVRVSMALLGILLLVAAIFMLSFYLPKQYQGDDTSPQQPQKEETLWDDRLHIQHKLDVYATFALNVTSALKKPIEIALKVDFGVLLTEAGRKNQTIEIDNNTYTVKFFDREPGLITLNISRNEEYPKCFEIHWNAPYTTKLQDCFDTISSHWFGLGEVFDQRWPLDKANFGMTPFLTSDYIDQYTTSKFGGVLEPFVFNSKGAGIYIDERVPLHVSMNEKKIKKMCLRSDPLTEYNRMYQFVLSNRTNDLRYTICIDENIKAVHKLMFDRFIEKPKETPDLDVIKKPIWSTWVRYKKTVNQSIIEEMTGEIKKYGFEYSHIQIEGPYSKAYGDYEFDTNKFSKVSNMLTMLQLNGFRLTVSVSPFINMDSQNFLKKTLDYGVKVGLKNTPGIAKWWNGFASILDVTNPKAREWFVNTLKEFQRLQISGFKFDTGETNYLPNDYRFSHKVPNPNYYSRLYAEIASNFKLSEVRVGYKSQKFPTFVRLLDRTSYWKASNGLQSVLTACLTFGILGYPYIVPDMVGGNRYLFQTNKELYVRWTQLSVFLPTIQFSITPWDYDQEVISIVREALEIRKNLTDIMVDAAKRFPETGEPIIRPLWWYWPDDHESFVADTEFMLADKYLIAPVMHLNIISHTVYVPQGIWEEQWGNREILNMTTGQRLFYNVTLYDICYFKLLSNITTNLEN